MSHLNVKADANTVVLYDWQGPNGKLIPDLIGNKDLTLTWTAMGGDRRVPWPGRKGRFPQDNGHGEHGWVTKVKGNPVLDLKTCKDEWTVEAWVRRGGPIQAHGKKYGTLPRRTQLKAGRLRHRGWRLQQRRTGCSTLGRYVSGRN